MTALFLFYAEVLILELLLALLGYLYDLVEEVVYLVVDTLLRLVYLCELRLNFGLLASNLLRQLTLQLLQEAQLTVNLAIYNNIESSILHNINTYFSYSLAPRTLPLSFDDSVDM